MIDNEIKNENETTEVYNTSNIVKIFENQRITLNKDIIFLKEDILKDFKRIENSLNMKYEKQNSNTVNKLYKFESIIEAMKTKIDDLSSIISTDKNIQQKVLQLTEFKRTTTNKLMNQDIAIKVNSSELKEAINKYDKILSDSVIYPAIIGSNAQFKDFHEMIDYILYGISQFNSFKDKNSIDFKEYAIKIENIYKSLKAQVDSIVSSCNTYCTKQLNALDTKIEKKLSEGELKIYDIRKENEDMKRNLEEKMKEINDVIRNINKARDELNKKYEEEKNIIEEFKDVINKDLNLINKRLKTLYHKLKKDGWRNKEMMMNSNSMNNQNSGINLKKSQLGTSLVKKYIDGEISFNEIENHEMKKKILKKSKEEKTTKKRMTLGPDKLDDVLNKNFLHKNSDIGYAVHSFKGSNKKEDDEMTFSSFDKDEYDKLRVKNYKESRNINQNKNGIKIPNLLSDEEYKSNDIYSTKQKAYQLLMLKSQREKSSNKNNSNRYKDYNENKNNIFENNNLNEDKNSIFTKLKSIGNSNNMFDYNNKKVKKRNNASVEFYEKINNNKKYNYYSIFDNYNDIKIKNPKNKLNVIEVNFDKKFQGVKEKDDLKDLIKKIKENRHYSSIRKNNYKPNNRIIKLSKSDASTNNLELFYKNNIVKEELKNYKSYEHLNNNFNSTKNSFQNKRLYSSKYS